MYLWRTAHTNAGSNAEIPNPSNFEAAVSTSFVMYKVKTEKCPSNAQQRPQDHIQECLRADNSELHRLPPVLKIGWRWFSGFIFERFTLETLTFSESSFRLIFLSAITLSRRSIIFPIWHLTMSHPILSVILRHSGKYRKAEKESASSPQQQLRHTCRLYGVLLKRKNFRSRTNYFRKDKTGLQKMSQSVRSETPKLGRATIKEAIPLECHWSSKPGKNWSSLALLNSSSTTPHRSEDKYGSLVCKDGLSDRENYVKTNRYADDFDCGRQRGH